MKSVLDSETLQLDFTADPATLAHILYPTAAARARRDAQEEEAELRRKHAAELPTGADRLHGQANRNTR